MAALNKVERRKRRRERERTRLVVHLPPPVIKTLIIILFLKAKFVEILQPCADFYFKNVAKRIEA